MVKQCLYSDYVYTGFLVVLLYGQLQEGKNSYYVSNVIICYYPIHCIHKLIVLFTNMNRIIAID